MIKNNKYMSKESTEEDEFVNFAVQMMKMNLQNFERQKLNRNHTQVFT